MVRVSITPVSWSWRMEVMLLLQTSVQLLTSKSSRGDMSLSLELSMMYSPPGISVMASFIGLRSVMPSEALNVRSSPPIRVL